MKQQKFMGGMRKPGLRDRAGAGAGVLLENFSGSPERPAALSGSLYHPILQDQVRYSSVVVPDEPDEQVRTTIGLMCQYANEDAQCPGIQNEARRIWGACGGDEREMVWAVWKLVRGKIQFLRDEQTSQAIEAFTSRTYEGMDKPIIEVLVRPRDIDTLKPGRRIGDCDDYSMYGAALLLALGIPCAFVTIAGDPRSPGQFTHVYVAAYPKRSEGDPGAGRVRVAVDASHGPKCGWEATEVRPGARVREWPLNNPFSGDIGGVVLAGLIAAALWVMCG